MADINFSFVEMPRHKTRKSHGECALCVKTRTLQRRHLIGRVSQTFVESCYAFATTALAAGLHRQHGYRVRFNDNPKYPQILEIVEEVPLPKPPASILEVSRS